MLTPQRLQRAIETRQLDWIRVDYRTVVFKRKSIAREAVLCVRDDGLDVEVVAQQAGAAVHSASECLADLSNAMRDRLLTARAGELIGPVAKDGAFVVHQIDAKRLPSLDDPAVRERVEARVLRQALDAAVDDLVQWYVEL